MMGRILDIIRLPFYLLRLALVWPLETLTGVVKQLTAFAITALDQDEKLPNEYVRLMNELQSKERENANKIRRLEEEKDSLTEEIKRYKARVSEMASEKLTEGNPTVEDMNDPHRPTALARRWNGLFRCGEYWTAFENVREAKGQDRAASILHSVCQVTYETTKKYMGDFTQALIDEVSSRHLRGLAPVNQRGEKTVGEFLSDNGDAENILRSLEDVLSKSTKDGRVGEGGPIRKAISQLLKSRRPPTTLSQAVTRAVGELKVSPELIRSFVDQLTELIYYMRVQDIKVVVDFECKAGRCLNPELYEVESGKAVDNPRSAVVKVVMRPALLRHEQGPVLCKGEVEIETPPRPTAAAETERRPQPGSNSKTPTRDIGTQTAADLATSDETNARRSNEGDTVSIDEDNKVASQSSDTAAATAD